MQNKGSESIRKHMLKTSERVEHTGRMSGFRFAEGKLIKHDSMNTHGGAISFIPRQIYPLDRRLGASQSQFGCDAEATDCATLQGVES